jgi:hypothetical protein
MTSAVKSDVVDVRISSTKPIVDAILEHPILDGTKKYSVEVTEFTTPLSQEGPLPPQVTFNTYAAALFLFRVRRKVAGVPIIHANNQMSNLTVIGPQFAVPANGVVGKDVFMPTSFRPIQTPNDLVFYLQEYFNDIKAVYANNPVNGAYAGGLIGAEHGGGPDITAANMGLDRFVTVLLTPNGTIRLYFSAVFCKHFFIETESYAMKLLGLDEKIIAFRTNPGGGVFTGVQALTGATDVDPIIAGETGETVVLQCLYPLIRHFDHRVRIVIDSGGMPIPSVVDWQTSNKQAIRHTLATFPINQTFETSLSLNSQGADLGAVRFRTKMFLGEITWRRAEDKISERFEITNSQFFQNVRLEVFIVRREWNIHSLGFDFKRRAISLADGESWTAKLRFRTF